MAKWAYVQAMVDHNFDDCHIPGTTLPVCFRHTVVEASDENAAYIAGHRWSDKQKDPAEVSLLNDYVFTI